jgi:hypothetical protein
MSVCVSKFECVYECARVCLGSSLCLCGYVCRSVHVCGYVCVLGCCRRCSVGRNGHDRRWESRGVLSCQVEGIGRAGAVGVHVVRRSGAWV